MEARVALILEYSELIQHRRDNQADPEGDGYCEKHHACPRSMGGSNRKENIILLPVREHIETHRVLAQMVGDQKWGSGSFPSYER